MTQLILPYDIVNDTPADAIPVEANYNVIAQFVNSQVINRDGTVAMQSPLLLPGDPTQPNHASNKGYVDATVHSVVDDAVDDIVSAHNDDTVFRRVVPSGNFDSSGAAYIDWVSLGDIDIPTWAKRAAITTEVNGSYTTIAATGILCLVKISFGTALGQPSGRLDYPAGQQRVNTAWGEMLTLEGTGLQPLRTQISRTAGAGAGGRADSGTITTCLIRFLPV